MTWLSEIEDLWAKELCHYEDVDFIYGAIGRMARVLRELAELTKLFFRPHDYEWEHLSPDAKELLECDT